MRPSSRTKIVATIGPASASVAMLERMIAAGMRVARLNFSHGDYPSHARLIRHLRTAAKNKGVEVAILQDLQGPRIRVGNVAADGITLSRGSRVALVGQSRHKIGLPGHLTIPIQYEDLYRDVKAGSLILIEDGTIQLKVLSVRSQVIYCKTLVAGIVKSHKGINVPGVTLTVDVITEKDKQDIVFGQANDVDFVALSFVKDAHDIRRLKDLIKRSQKKGTTIPTMVIAKIERREALVNLDEILHAVDGLMVARGDLGLEIPAQEVPLWQKDMIQRCQAAAKPVIVATQMLDSMIRNPQPTRAEVSDVANAVIDHTDAVMLSGESATGKYPLEAVQMMGKIATTTEASGFDNMPCVYFDQQDRRSSIALSVCDMSKHVQAKAIIVMTRTGDSVRLLSRHRPELPLVALTPEKRTLRQLALSWGVTPATITSKADFKTVIRAGVNVLYKAGQVQHGDMVIAVGSEPYDKVKEMNMIRLVRVGEQY
ncbi:MAG: pyruvate kinase [Parcubacteria group bacterium]|nr:pyruvate kinase [Parcubacteria group bacterium]